MVSVEEEEEYFLQHRMVLFTAYLIKSCNHLSHRFHILAFVYFFYT